jgi:hypothetical protein
VDIQKFVSTLRGIAKHGFEPKGVIAEFQNLQYLDDKQLAVEIAIDEMQKDLARYK